MKNALAKYFLGFFGAIGALLAGLAGYQQVCLRMARKKKDETHVMETYHAKEGEIAYRSVGHGKPLDSGTQHDACASGREWDAVIDALAEVTRYTFRICPASAILSVPKSHGQHINMQICCMHSSRMSSVIPSASAVRMAVRILVYCFLCCTRRISAAWCSFPRRASGTALRPTRTRNSFRSCSPPLQARSIFSSAQANGKSEPHWSRQIFAKETVSAELVQQYARAARFGTHAQATFACPENTLLGSRYQACL